MFNASLAESINDLGRLDQCGVMGKAALGQYIGCNLVTFARWTGSSYVLWVLVGVLLSRVITLVRLRDKFLLIALAEVLAGWRTPDWTQEQVETTWTELRK